MSTLKTPVRIAIIGCGQIARLHVQQLAADARAEIVALVDDDRRAAESLRRIVGHELHVDTHLDSMLNTVAPDAVVVATPTHCHYEQARICGSRGVHVLCEKPLADTRRRIASLVELFSSGKPCLTVAYQRRHWSTYRTLRREICSGRWGDIRSVTSHNVENWQQTIAGTWRDDPAMNPGGFIGDAGSHKIDTIFYTTGLTSLEVFAHTQKCGSNVEITATVSATLSGGVPLSVDFIGNAQYLGEDLHIHCALADLMIRDGRLWIAENGDISAVDNLEPESNPDSGFLDLLTGEADNIAPAHCAVAVFDFTQALLESGRTGRLVRIET